MKLVFYTFLRLLVYGILMFLCTIPIEADFKISQVNEDGAIEFAQEAILFLTIIVGFASAYFSKNFRIFMSVLALFIGAHFIREFDAWFDGVFPSLGWFPFVLVLALIALVILIKNFKKFINQINALRNTFGFGILMISFAYLHVFTRIYGKPSIWRNIMGDNYLYSVERGAEESVELIAYLMILIAVSELFLFIRKESLNNKMEMNVS